MFNGLPGHKQAHSPLSAPAFGGCRQARPGCKVKHLMVGWGNFGLNGTQQAAQALFLHASPLSFRPVGAHCRFRPSCKSLVVKAEWHVPAHALVQG